MGTYGSRSLAVGSEAIVKALDKVIAKARKIAAHVMEASEADIEFKDGNFTVAGTDRSMAFGEVALTAYVPHNFPHHELEPGLDEKEFYDPLNFTFPGGCQLAGGADEPHPGLVRVERGTAAEHRGRARKPGTSGGQTTAGPTQGGGQ